MNAVPKKKAEALTAMKKRITVEIAKGGVEVVSIDNLHLWEDNPRRNDQAVDRLMEILIAHGQVTPVTVWKKNMTIYKGNTTWKAMKKSGAKEILVRYRDFPSESAAKAYGISDNKGGEFSEWDEDLLLDMIEAEDMQPFMDRLGFDDIELRGLTMEADVGKIDKTKETDEGILSVIKIKCLPQDKDEIFEMLKSWAADCGFEGILVLK